MHICHVSSMHRSRDDRIFERACRGLVNEGHEVTFIVTHERPETIHGVRILPLTPRPLGSKKRRLLSSIEAFRHARNTDADIFVFHDPDLIPYMLLLALMGRKVVYDIHENHLARILDLPLPQPFIRLAAWIYRLLELVVYQAFAGLVTTTHSMNQLYSFTNRPVQTVQNTVYLPSVEGEGINLTPPKREPVTIYTSGGNGPKRNCMQTIEAFPLIKAKHPDVKMMFVGSYKPDGYDDELRAKVKEMGLEDDIEILGKLPWAENFERTARMQIGCVFYENNANNRVTLPNRLFEYMACGVAVLGEDFPEVRRVVNEAGCGALVNSSSPESIAAGAIKLLDDREALARMGEAGRQAILGSMGYEQEVKALSRYLTALAR